jgi:hypothetical protein
MRGWPILGYRPWDQLWPWPGPIRGQASLCERLSQLILTECLLWAPFRTASQSEREDANAQLQDLRPG